MWNKNSGNRGEEEYQESDMMKEVAGIDSEIDFAIVTEMMLLLLILLVCY